MTITYPSRKVVQSTQTTSDFAFKVDLYDGGSAVEFGYPQPLPPIQTNSRTRTHWLHIVNAVYTCDGTLLGWNSYWAENAVGPDLLPREMDRQIRSHQFGRLPSGDVVTAIVDSQTSVSWGADYSGIPSLDPDSPDPSETHPDYVSFTGDCFFMSMLQLSDVIDSNGDGLADSGSNPFNMTWSTALWEISNAWLTGSPQRPRYDPPRIHVSLDQITDPFTGRSDASPGNPKYDALQTKCRELSAMPQDWVHGCPVQISGELNQASFVQSPVLKSATYTTTEGVNAIEVVGEVAGNRGAARTFVTTWR